MAKIRDIAQICKSKNAGPFSVTIDVLFEDHALYHRVKATGVLNAALFSKLYNVSESDVLFTPYDAAAASSPGLEPEGRSRQISHVS